jgi:DNA replication and repair protein RecF
MLLESIEAKNFRNLQGEIVCNLGLNVLVGDNGQGKTNWLEAIFLLATTRSFKTTKLNEAVRFGEDLAIVRGPVCRSEEIHRNLQVSIDKNIKALTLNGKRIPAKEYLGELHAVLFNSDGLEIVRGTPDARRRFLDDAIVAIHPPYVQTLSDYGRVIRQKNSLLQTARERETSLERTSELLEPWNAQLAALAERIQRSRVRITERLNAELDQRFFDREEFSLRYVSSLEGKGDLADYGSLIAERLRLRVQAELVAGHALIGTHRDDLEILFDGRDLRKYGSSGQQRSALLSLQIANISLYYSQQNEYPLFLIDDIDAELDNRRIAQLLEYLDGKTQTIVTTSKPHLAAEIVGKGELIYIQNGSRT